LGGEIVLAAVVNKGDTDMLPVLTAVAASHPEFVFLPVFPSEGSLLVQQAKMLDALNSVIWMGDSALANEAFLDAVRTDGIGMYFITEAPTEGPAGKQLFAEYQRKYAAPPEESFVYVRAYDAANLLLHAIEHVAVREEDGTVHIGRQALREALYDTTEFDGVSGLLTCDEFGDCGSCGMEVYRLDDPAKGLEGLKSNVIYTYRYSQ
jgi:branched-chain amino acid transport system substrate-binding protein